VEIRERLVELQGQHVLLRPLQLEDTRALAAFAFDESLWRYTTTSIRTDEDLQEYITTALAWREAGTAVPFATCLKDGTVVGSTRFANIDIPNQRAEIGWTWVGKSWQRTAVNTEAKFLMLRHAFETWGCERVELKTGSRNERSRAAILRLGAKEEGVLRRHMLLHDGTYRDTVYYSILKDEWPAVKEGLLRKMEMRA